MPLSPRLVACLQGLRRFFDWPVYLRWAVFVAYALFVAWVSLTPSAAFRPVSFLTAFYEADKLYHFFIYGWLVLLFRWALAARARRFRAAWLVVLGAITYGVLMEILQSLLLPGDRFFSYGDICANALGALVFWHLSRLAAP